MNCEFISIYNAMLYNMVFTILLLLYEQFKLVESFLTDRNVCNTCTLVYVHTSLKLFFYLNLKNKPLPDQPSIEA
uniref:Putative ovule protein n=1 Tax=Solanum chacoense TaxID=4108 RepID=A0A0V0HDF9_SOLCH